MSDHDKTNRKRVYFRFTSDTACRVHVAGSFNDWDPDARPLRKGRGGTWRTHVSLAPGRYEYRFVVDGTWVNDPEAPTADNDQGTTNCIKIVPPET